MASIRQKRKVSEVMGEYKGGKLKSGSGGKVKSRRQAVAIAMSESGQSRKRKKTAPGKKMATGKRSSAAAKRKR